MHTVKEIQVAFLRLPSRDQGILRVWLRELEQWQVREAGSVYGTAPEFIEVQKAVCRLTPEQRRQLREWMDQEDDQLVLDQLTAHARYPIWSLCTNTASAAALTDFMREKGVR